MGCAPGEHSARWLPPEPDAGSSPCSSGSPQPPPRRSLFPLALVLLVSRDRRASQASDRAWPAARASWPCRTSRPPTWRCTWTRRRPARACRGACWPGSARSKATTASPTAPGVHSGANYAGAEGPMQFEPATFAQYAVDADHDGPLSPYDPADAIYTAAAMLCANGAASGTPAGIRQAVFAYNHSQAYVTDVLSWAARYTVPAPSARRRDRDRVRAAPGRQALPVGRRRAERLRLLRPGLRRLRRRGHPHRPHHVRVAPGRPAGPAVARSSPVTCCSPPAPTAPTPTPATS